MADQMKPTPRSPILGLFSDVLGRTLNMPSLPRTGIPAIDLLYANRNPVFNAMGVGDVQKTAERISYGEPLTTGSGMTTKPREETLFAGMAVAPFAPAMGRVAGRAIRATEGLPVGMSIKDVGQNIFEDATKYHQKVPEIKSINVDKLKRMNAGEVADVSDEVAAKMDFSKPIQVSVFADGELRIVDGHHRVAAAKKLGIKSLPVELQAINAKGSTLNKLAQEATYPQQAALDLAQQRAALPVSEGGLGLPPNNTPEMRAQAMGFDVDFAHGSPQSNITRFEPSKTGEMGSGIYATNYFPEADIYAGKEIGATTYPLKVKTNTAYQAGEENPYMKLIVSDDEQLQKALQRMGKESIIKTQQPPPDWLKALGTMDMPIREHFVSMNPDLFRSRFAAFDPFRKDVATATAMGVALPDLLAQPVNQYRPTYEPIPTYTDPFGNTIDFSIR